jgi:hypothetical protein
MPCRVESLDDVSCLKGDGLEGKVVFASEVGDR